LRLVSKATCIFEIYTKHGTYIITYLYRGKNVVCEVLVRCIVIERPTIKSFEKYFKATILDFGSPTSNLIPLNIRIAKKMRVGVKKRTENGVPIAKHISYTGICTFPSTALKHDYSVNFPISS
jgi:hypothetical protein